MTKFICALLLTGFMFSVFAGKWGRRLFWGGVGGGLVYLYMKNKEVKSDDPKIQKRIDFCNTLKEEAQKLKCFEAISEN